MILFGKDISYNKDLVIVAEISCNHKQDKEKAFRLINAAKNSGADAVKIQIYTPDDMCLPNIYKIKHGLWKDKDLYELYTSTQTDLHLAREMLAYAKEIDFPLFASIFSIDTLNIVKEWDLPVYKVASFEITDTNLIIQMAKTGKPVIISTGAATQNEIEKAFMSSSWHNTILMHCVSAYPAKLENINLTQISKLSHLYGVPVGFSDHTPGNLSGAFAVMKGAVILEKHLMLDRSEDTEDRAFSLDPKEFSSYVAHAKAARLANRLMEVPEEKENQIFKRSIFVVKNLKKGDRFSKDTIKCLRPNLGIPAYQFNKLLFLHAKEDIKAGTPLTENLIQGKIP